MFEIKTPFGVELEFSSRRVDQGDLDGAFTDALRNFGEELTRRESPENWTLKSDPSCGFEVTTPVLRTMEDLLKLKSVIKDVQSRFKGRSIVSRDCGLHVHFDVDNFSRRDLRKIFQSFARVENFLYKLVPNSRRDGSYCHSLCRHRSYDTEETPFSTDHYTAVNVSSWYHRGTMEVRYAAGSCHHEKVTYWVALLQGVIARAVEGEPPQSNLTDLRSFWQWMGQDFQTDWDEAVAMWVNKRYEYLENHNPEQNRRRYHQAREIRDRLPRYQRHYHYYLRRDMSRDQRRAHDQAILDRHEAGTLTEWDIPQEWLESYFEERPDERSELVGPQGEVEAATVEASESCEEAVLE